MSLVAVHEVVRPQHLDSELVGMDLVSPGVGESDVYALNFEGWVLTRTRRAVALQISGDRIPAVDIPLGVPRPDLVDLYPDIPWALSNAGFRAAISTLRFPPEFSFDLYALLEDGGRVPIATVKGTRRVPASPETGLDPIIVTTLGRTGGTWVTQLLASHPDVIAYPPFRSEIKVASYWAEVLMHLSEPGGYLQSVQALVGGDDWWLGRGRRYDEEQTDEELTHWLGKGQIESIRDFCRGRVDAFYRDLADRMGDGEPSYFVEKGLPNPLGQLELMQSMYPGMREIVLVRDFRDMLSSIFAYNDKRGFPYFGRDLANSDEEYVANYLGPDVDRLARAWRQRSDTAHLLRYEDLVFEPQETLAAVLTYLELEPDTGVIDHMLATGSAKPTEGQRGHPTTASARESVGRWADDLSPKLIRACESAFGVALQTFGYSVGRVGATATAGGTS